MKILLSFLTLCLCAASPVGATCRQRVVVQQQVAAVDYSQAVVAAVYAPLAVYIPAYSIGYSPSENLFGRGGQPPAPQTPDPTLAQLLQEVQKIRAEVEAIKSGGTPAPGPKLEPLPPLGKLTEQPAHMKLFSAKCASCHEKAVAEKKGGNFVLLEGGDLAKLTDGQRLKVASQMYTGKMPKNSKATDEDVGVVMSWIDAQK